MTSAEMDRLVRAERAAKIWKAMAKIFRRLAIASGAARSWPPLWPKRARR